MPLSSRAQQLHDQMAPDTPMGTLKNLAKEIKKDHGLALELWSTAGVRSRLLAVLIMDKKRLDQDLLDSLCADLQVHPKDDDQTRIMEWLMANQLMKSAAGNRLIESWEHSDSALQRRTFWYHQARLRWQGKTSQDNTGQLLDALEARLEEEEPMVQWAMNFLAGWVGVYQPEHRDRLVALGERVGLYKEQVVPRNCTPNYLPEFIRIEVEKRVQ